MTQTWPGDTPNTSVAYQIFATPRPLTSDAEKEAVRQTIETTVSIIEREDYWAVDGQQNNLESMKNKKSIYGRLEPMVQTFERSVNEIVDARSEEHTSEIQSLIRTSYDVLCLKKKNDKIIKLQNAYTQKSLATNQIKQ